jgi:hypothetical protein
VPSGTAVLERKIFKVVNIIENGPKYLKSKILHDLFNVEF